MSEQKPHCHAKLIHAWAEGEIIQAKYGDVWYDDPLPSWHAHIDYRLKPDTPEQCFQHDQWYCVRRKNLTKNIMRYRGNGYFSNEDGTDPVHMDYLAHIESNPVAAHWTPLEDDQ